MRTTTFMTIGALAVGVICAGPTQAQTQSPPAQAVQSFTATLTGPVTNIDKTKGRVTVQSIDGPVTLRFPPDALAKLTGLKQGDRVTFGLAFVERPAAAASPKTEDSTPSASPGGSSGAGTAPSQPSGPPVGLTGTVEGNVERVDAQAGKLAVKTDEGTANLRFPAGALQGLKPGDRVTVHVALIERSR